MPSVVLYDGDCGFCRWVLARLLAWDRAGKLRPLEIQSNEGETLLAALRPDRRLASWHLVSPSGRLYSGGAAVAPLMRLLPGARSLAWLAARSPALTEGAYRWVAENRSKPGRLLTSGAKRRAKNDIDARESQMRDMPLPEEARPCSR
jgi:predicted DCC family thiol-disulfide oxidoreductase YuxK